MIELYYKTVSKGGKPTYHKLTPDSSGAETVEITNQQAITAHVTLVYPIISSIIDRMPQHKKAAREVRKLLDASVELLRGTGQEIDYAFAEHLSNAWNMAMTIAELTDFERVEA